MRRIGATCTAAPKRMRCKYIAAREYDRKCGGIRERRRVPVGMASLGFAATDCSGRRQWIGKVAAAHLRSKVSAYDIRRKMRGFRTA